MLNNVKPTPYTFTLINMCSQWLETVHAELLLLISFMIDALLARIGQYELASMMYLYQIILNGVEG